MPKGIYEPIGVGSGSGSSGSGSSGRTLLTGNATYDVNSITGNDTPGSPLYKTLQYVWNYNASAIDGGGFTFQINLQGAGPYTLDAEIGPLNFSAGVVLGAGSGTTQATIASGNNNSFVLCCTVYFDSMEFIDQGSGECFSVDSMGPFAIGGINNDVKFGPAATKQLNIFGTGAQVQMYGAPEFTGTSPYGIWVGGGGCGFYNASTIAFAGGASYDAFYFVTEGGLIDDYFGGGAATYTGSFTGAAYNFVTGGQYAGQSTNIPGSLPGVVIGGFDPDAVKFASAVPTTGGTVAMTLLKPSLYLRPAGTLATLTVDLPPIPVVAGLFGYAVLTANALIVTTQTITALTLATTDGSSIVGAPASLAANTQILAFYDAATNTWYCTSAPSGGGSGLVVNSTTISGGSAGQILYDNGGTLEEVDIVYSISTADVTLSTPGTSLTLAESGDTFGTVSLQMLNRNGANGAIFSNLGVDLVDFGFIPSSAAQANIRFEHRSGQILAANANGEFQFIGINPGTGKWFIVGGGVVQVGAGIALQLGNTYVNTPIVPTGYVTVQDAAGTTYKIAVST